MTGTCDARVGSPCHLKICGLTRPEDVTYVNEARRELGGPDFAGFMVTYSQSRRHVTEARLRELTARLDPQITAVGVFVDEPPEAVARLLREGVIGACQLHGSEDAAYIRRLRELSGETGLVIRAFRIPAECQRDPEACTPTEHLEKWFAEIEHCPADLVLIDSGAGSGETFDWSALTDEDGRNRLHRGFLLAGGLTPDNIPEAVRQVQPWGVDLSSGVETDGVKDESKIRAAIKALFEAYHVTKRTVPAVTRKDTT